ncbi:sortase, partial [Eubacterium aggregans]
PIGGQGTHAVLTSHTGLPSAKLFTDLHKVKIGERFYITVLNQCLTYEIISMDTVLPEEVNRLKAVENEDLVTLVTCTPYGVNDHRLFVRGRRCVENNSGPSPMSSVKLPKEVAFLILLPLGIVSLLIFVIIHKQTK